VVKQIINKLGNILENNFFIVQVGLL